MTKTKAVVIAVAMSILGTGGGMALSARAQDGSTTTIALLQQVVLGLTEIQFQLQNIDEHIQAQQQTP